MKALMTVNKKKMSGLSSSLVVTTVPLVAA